MKYNLFIINQGLQNDINFTCKNLAGNEWKPKLQTNNQMVTRKLEHLIKSSLAVNFKLQLHT